jgi:hypothetical protein
MKSGRMIRLEHLASMRKIRNAYKNRKTLVGRKILGNLGINGRIILQIHS